jgi:hypothetical protein
MNAQAAYWRDNEEAAYVHAAEEAEGVQEADGIQGETAAQWRDRIARQMWDDYQAYLAAHPVDEENL